VYENIGRSRGTDYFRIADQLTREELDYLRRTTDLPQIPYVSGGGALAGTADETVAAPGFTRIG
jgi:hypothetical protein